jgi:hypothetical protein
MTVTAESNASNWYMVHNPWYTSPDQGMYHVPGG